MTTEFQKGMHRAAELALLYADENIRMADDTVALDPILNPANHHRIKNQAMLSAAMILSEKLGDDGAMHGAKYDAGRDIAELIRDEARRLGKRR